MQDYADDRNIISQLKIRLCMRARVCVCSYVNLTQKRIASSVAWSDRTPTDLPNEHKASTYITYQAIDVYAREYTLVHYFER